MTVNSDTLRTWMESYIKAWNTNDPLDIGALFSPEARYFTTPYRRPWSGRDEIIAGWLDRKDEPDEFRFRYEILGQDGNTCFVRGWTEYLKEKTAYTNLWVIRLNDRGECWEFIEWWMLED